MTQTPSTAPLTPREITVCRNIGRQLGRRNMDAETALHWLQRWVREVGGTR